MFFSYDTDGTGNIEKKEFEEICESQHVFLDPRMFLAIDTDDSGTITLEELLTLIFMSAPKAMIREMAEFCEKTVKTRQLQATARMNKITLADDQVQELREMFQAYDTDNSGTLTVQELISVMGSGALELEDIEEMMKDSDKNSDGALTFDEFVKMLTGGQAKKKRTQVHPEKK